MPAYPLASPHRVLVVVAESYGVTLDALTSRGQQASLVAARRAAAWLLQDLTMLSQVEIGRALKRDPSTVIYTLARARQEAGLPAYAKHLESLRDKILA